MRISYPTLGLLRINGPVTLTCAGAQLSLDLTVTVRAIGTTVCSTTPVCIHYQANGTVTSTVTSVPAGVTCTGFSVGETKDIACAPTPVAVGDTVTLTAVAVNQQSFPGMVFGFVGWQGACSGTAATCTIAMSEARSVTAIFSATGPPPDF